MCSPGQARDGCLSYSQARAAYPGKHLRWYGSAHCWTKADDVRIAADVARPRHSHGDVGTRDRNAGDPVDQSKTILMPSMMRANGQLGAEYLDSHSMLFWPQLLDLDQLQRQPFEPWNERIRR
jgi:hypothetical protein